MLLLIILFFFQLNIALSENNIIPNENQLINEVDTSIHENFKDSTNIKKKKNLEEIYKELNIDSEISYSIIIPSFNYFDYYNQLKIQSTYIRFIYSNSIDSISTEFNYNYQLQNLRLAKRFDLPYDHPAQNSLKCTDYLNFGILGPFWPKESPSLNFYKEHTDLDYDIFDNYSQNNKRHAVSYYNNYYIDNKNIFLPYIIYGKYALITYSGNVIFSDRNYYNPKQDCYNKFTYNLNHTIKKIKNFHKKNNFFFKQLFSKDHNDTVIHQKNKDIIVKTKQLASPDYSSSDNTFHDTVFVISSYKSSDYDQFIYNCLSRLAFSLNFLNENPSVKIHIFPSEKTIDKKIRLPNSNMRKKLFALLGISESRIIDKTVLAENVIIPRQPNCKLPMRNLYNLLYIGNRLLLGALNDIKKNLQYIDNPSSNLPGINSFDDVVNIINPYILAYKNDEDYFTKTNYYNKLFFEKYNEIILNNDREKNILILQNNYKSAEWHNIWDDETFSRIIESFKKFFPEYNFIIIPNKIFNQTSEIDFYTSTILNFARADIIVTSQGQYLSNVIFTKPSSLIVEINNSVNDEILPVCGEDTQTSSMFGHDHLIYFYKSSKDNFINSDYIAEEAFIYKKALENLRSKYDSKFVNNYPFIWYNIKNVDFNYNNITFSSSPYNN